MGALAPSHRPPEVGVAEAKGISTIYSYEEVCEPLIHEQVGQPPEDRWHPCLIPDWDNSPRSGRNGLLVRASTPELFQRQVRLALSLVADVPAERRIVFVKSWNEWAEGNYLEPDLRFGHGYLRALQAEASR